jgi:LacI family transcriptional regulator
MITQRQIAESLGVSSATVANILSQRAGLRYSQKTRDIVHEAAKELGYQPNRASQAIRKQRSNLIAIVHFGAGIEAAHKANTALSRKVHEVGFDYLSVDMDWHGGSVERTLAELIQNRVEGVLISHIQEVFSDKHLDVIRRAGIPVVSINGGRRPGVTMVSHDAVGPFQRLTTHLLNAGHRRILCLSPAAAQSNEAMHSEEVQRAMGFRQAIEETGTCVKFSENQFLANLPAGDGFGDGVSGIVVQQDFRLYQRLQQPVYRFCKELFASGNLPDAIVCMNDKYAVEAIMAAQELGVRIPHDVAVTGYDNDLIGSFPVMGITTAEQDIENICKAGVEELVKLVQDPSRGISRQTFDSMLVLRTSCGRMLQESRMEAHT